MKVKYEGKSGKREIRNCNYCKEDFETMSTKVRQGGELFCSSDCYQQSRKSSEEDKKKNHINNQRMYKYGLDEEGFNQLMIESNNSCMICRTKFTDDTRYTTACVDHCHETNKVRGLLCHTCNKGLGIFDDKIELLQNAIGYLIKNKQIEKQYE